MNTDAWSPAEIAARVRTAGETKARAPLPAVALLSLLGGAFIAIGAMLSIVATTGSALGAGPTRLLGGLVFSVGLVLVVVAGAELFTGNNLVAMAWASRRIRTAELLRGWLIVYVGNVIGALGTVQLVALTDIASLSGGAVGETALAVGLHKADLAPLEVLARGILCNALVCLAVWLAMGGRSVTDKILGVVFPVTAFVALGFEHSIANWFFLPYAASLGALNEPNFLMGAVRNLALSTLGNMLGGTLLVAAVYWLAYLAPWASRPQATAERDGVDR